MCVWGGGLQGQWVSRPPPTTMHSEHLLVTGGMEEEVALVSGNESRAQRRQRGWQEVVRVERYLEYRRFCDWNAVLASGSL